MTFRLWFRLVAALVSATLTAGCSSSWQYTDITMERCVTEAKLAMRDSDFTQNLRVAGARDERTVLGEHGSYKGSVTCVPGRRTVEVTGVDLAMIQFYKQSIIKRF